MTRIGVGFLKVSDGQDSGLLLLEDVVLFDEYNDVNNAAV